MKADEEGVKCGRKSAAGKRKKVHKEEPPEDEVDEEGEQVLAAAPEAACSVACAVQRLQTKSGFEASRNHCNHGTLVGYC
eukprot:4660996-Pleurochrysis_carterae.AAC.5